MKAYFQLQYKMFNRHLIDFGILPALAYILLTLLFWFGSEHLFFNLPFAIYIYPFIGISFVFKLAAKHRNDFLKLTFSSNYKKIRIVENSITILPFVFYLCYQQSYLVALLTLLVAISISFVTFNTELNMQIPTPFKQYPFEFTEGFRKTFLVFPIAYALCAIAIKVTNINLAIFSLLVVFGTAISYYYKNEESFFVWLHNQSPKKFLYLKIKRALVYVSWLSLPLVMSICLFFSSKILIVIAFQMLGYLYLILFIIMKYS